MIFRVRFWRLAALLILLFLLMTLLSDEERQEPHCDRCAPRGDYAP